MDMTGQGQIIHLFSKACRNELFSSEELAIGNLARENLIPLLDDSYSPGPELAFQMVKPIPPSTEIHPTPPPSKCTWAYFIFPPTALSALKSLATKTITIPSFISTDDALTAFIWQEITRARLPRLTPSSHTTIARAVNVRHHINIPAKYPGLVQNMTYHISTFQELVEEPLGAIASRLRCALDSNLGYNTQALATVLHRAADKSLVSVTASINPSTDVMLSSWAKVNCDLDFVGLGTPEAVRRPRFVPFESLVYFMPKKVDGEVAVAVCLRGKDMAALRADGEFVKYARFVG